MNLQLNEMQDESAEMAVIGSCLMDDKAITRIIDKIGPRDFYNKRCAIVFEQIIINFAKNIAIDLVTINNFVKDKDVSASWLTDCAEKCVSSANVEHYAEIVKEYSKRRKLKMLFIKQINDFEKFDSDYSVDDLALDTQNQILEITSDTTIKNVDFHDVVNLINERLENRLNQVDKKIEGYWNYKYTSHKLNDLTGGIEPQTFIVLGALKKSGKSKFITDQIVNLVVNQKAPVLFLSLEMGEESVTRMLWSRIARVNSQYIKNPIDHYGKSMLSGDELNRLKQTKHIIENIGINLIVDTRSFLDLNQVRAKILQSIQFLGVRVVVIDYLQRCKFDTRRNQTDARAIELFAQGLADIAKDNKICIFALSQLRKVAEGKYATVADIKESGGIPENATHIFLLNNVDRVVGSNGKDKPFLNKTVLDVIQRDGSAGRVDMSHDLRIGRFVDDDEPLFDEEGVPF